MISGCEVNELIATGEWDRALTLIEAGHDIHHRDSFNGTPLEWSWTIPLNLPEKFLVMERLLDRGAPLNFNNMAWKHIIESSVIYNANRKIPFKLILEKLIYFAYKESPVELIQLDDCTFNFSFFSLLCKCRAGVSNLDLFRDIMNLIISSVAEGSIADVCGRRLLYTLSVSQPHTFRIISMCTTYPIYGPPPPALWSILESQSTPTSLFIQCIHVIRQILVNVNTRDSLYRSVQSLSYYLPTKLLSRLTLDDCFNGEWNVANFLVSHDYIMGNKLLDI